jgi:hypothetical protein
VLQAQVMKTNKRLLGEEHSDTLLTISDEAVMYPSQRRWTEAEELQAQVIRKIVLGEEHPDTLYSIAGLASIYNNKRLQDNAENLEVQVILTKRQDMP